MESSSPITLQIENANPQKTRIVNARNEAGYHTVYLRN